MKKLITLLALCCLMVTGAWADGPTVYTAGAPIDILSMSNGSSKTVLMYAAGNGNSGFVYVNKDGTERFNISGAKSALTDGSKFYEYTLTRNTDGTFTVKTLKNNKYLPGWPSTSGGNYGPGDQLGGNGTYVTSFNAAACTSSTTSLEGGNTYTFTANRTDGIPVQHEGNIFKINNDGTHNVALQFCTFTKVQLVAGNSYSIKSKFSDKTNSHYLCENGSGVTASATFPADNSGYWTYTSDGKFQNLQYTSRYLIGNSGFKSDGTGTAFTLQAGLANGTVTFYNGSTSYAVKKDGTTNGGQYSQGTKQFNTGDWTTDMVLEESGTVTYMPYADGEFTYGPLSGTSWSVWSGDVPAGLSALGSTYNATNLKVIEKYYHFEEAGILSATFTYTSGNNRLDIAGVQVLSSDGVQVVADFHVGKAGNPSANNDYTVTIPEGGDYIVRYISTANCGSEQNINTNGKVTNAFIATTPKDYTVHIVNAPTGTKVTYKGVEYGDNGVIEDAILQPGDIVAPTFDDLTLVGVTINGTNIYVNYGKYKVVFDNAHSNVPYRIPAVGQAANGDLIFVSDYRYSHADIGSNTRLDLKYRKKYADGHWGDEKPLAQYIPDPFCAFGDPCIVCDRTSNRVMVTSCCGNIGFPTGTHENHQGWAQWYSTDNGETWSEHHVDISKQVMDQVDQRTGCTLASFFIGSGKISQSHIIKKGQYYRLYCSSNTRINNPGGSITKMNFVWYSDDFGETWTMLGTPDETPIDGGDEPKADELPDGSVVVSSRDTGRIFNIFHYTDYENAEGYWGTQATSSNNNNGCYGTGCNGEILIVPVMKKSDNSKTYLALQSIPADANRNYVSIYWKELTDFTKYRNASELAPNWTKFPVSTTTSAYSTMCQMQDGHVAFFYEENSYNDGYDMIYKNFTIEDITSNLYEFYDLNAAANASEKAAYLTGCVGTYFDNQSEEIQTLAEAYEADPTMKKYDALNAGIIAALNKTYKKGVAVTQQSDLQNGDLVIIDVKAKNATTDAVLYYVGQDTSMSNRNNFRAHIYNVTEYPANHVWEVVDVNTSTTPNTFKLRSVINNTIYLPSGNTTSATNTAATFYFKESTGYNDGVNRFALAFSNNENADHYTYHFNAKPATGQGEPICFWGYGAASTDSQGAFAFYKVAEDIPTPALSIETNTTVTSSQLSELSITFTGANAAQVQLSETKNKAYLTPKASTPAQVKAQNGKLKAAGETPAAIEGNITKDANTDGKFNIAFEDEIPAGDYELSIPEGTFLVGTTPVPVLKANYTVEESAPALPPYADLPLTSGVYEIQNSPTMSGGNRGYLVDYTSYTNGPSLAECHYSGCENKHPNAKNDGSTTSSKWYVYNDNGTYYIVSLSTLGGKNTPQFLNPASPSTYSTEKVALTIAQHSSNTVQGSDGNTYHSNLISKSTSVYLSAACGTASTSGAVKTDTNGNDGGAPWVFIPCDESTLTTEQVALRDKAIEIIEIPTAGKVYTIKAHFTSDSYTDIYLTSDTGAEQLLLPMPTTATANQSYWVAEASGNTDRPWKFKSGYGYAKYLDWQSGTNGLSANGDNFGVLDCGTVPGTYHLNVSTNDRNIGTWGNNNDTKKGFGAVGSGGCWSQNKGHSNATATNYWTTDYEIVAVAGVTAYKVSCETTDGGVAPAFANYGGVATVKNGGYIIVPNGTTLDATNFPAAEISGYTGSVTFNGTTITVTYEASATPDGFHIYENNGTYSNVSSSSASFRDKWTSTQDAPRFEIFAHENGNSNGSNNMKPDATYANSGIVCYSGNKTNNISGMTVSIPTNGYVITGYSFKVKNYDTGDYSITVSAGESSVNTSSENKTISVSGLSVSSFEIIIDGSNGSLNKGVVLTDFYVTYAEGEHDVEVPATGYYYIKDNGQYLYNDFLNHPEATQSIATKQTYDNGYVWKVTSTESSTTVTLLNGEGSGYKANAGAEEETSIDLTGKNWTFEACGHKIITCNVLYDVMGDYATFDKGYVINADLNSVAHDGGFFVVDENEMLHASDFKAFEQDVTQGTIMGTTAPDGTKWAGVRMYDGLHVKNISAYYYTEQDVERYLDVVKKTYEVFYKHEGEPGYCTELDWDFENNPDLAVLFEIVQGFFFYDEDEIPLDEYVQDMIEPYEAKYYLGKLCNYIKGLEIAPPVQGEAYRIAVRGNDYTGNTKYYLKNDGTYTANEAEADVFVLGGSGDETCGSLLVTNNNPGTEGGIHYLQVRADGVAMNTEYKEADNALNLVSMTKAEGENIQSCPAYLYGTFSATNKDGKVLTFDETGDGSWISDAESLYMKDNKTSAIELIPVEYPYNKPKFAVGSPDDHDGGYASIWLPYPMVFPEGVEAYRATNVENDGILILTKVNEDTNTVAAGGYILYTPGQGEDTDPDNLPLVLPAPADPEDVTPYADNAFVGSTENPLVVKEEGSWATFKAKYEGTAYVLARKNNVIGYYKYRETETCLPKGKAIWFSNYNADSSAECLRFTFEEVISAIEALHGNTDKAEIYDLQGHRLNKVEKGQVNVINGKKVMFK